MLQPRNRHRHDEYHARETSYMHGDDDLPPSYNSIIDVPEGRPSHHHRDLGRVSPEKTIDTVRRRFDTHQSMAMRTYLQPETSMTGSIMFYQLSKLLAESVVTMSKIASYEPSREFQILVNLESRLRRCRCASSKSSTAYDQRAVARDCIKLCLELHWRMLGSTATERTHFLTAKTTLTEVMTYHNDIDLAMCRMLRIAFRHEALTELSSVYTQLKVLRSTLRASQSRSMDFLFEACVWSKTTIMDWRGEMAIGGVV